MKITIYATLLWIFNFSAFGQGRFLFNTFDLAAGNQVNFSVNGGPATGPDLFVEVWAGPVNETGAYSPLRPLLALNGTGAFAGYTSPLAQVFTTGLPGGTTAFIMYRMFKGATPETASLVSNFERFNHVTQLPLSVMLTEPPAEPNEIFLRAAPLILVAPEPPSYWLGLIGIGFVMVLWQSKSKRRQ